MCRLAVHPFLARRHLFAYMILVIHLLEVRQIDALFNKNWAAGGLKFPSAVPAFVSVKKFAS